MHVCISNNVSLHVARMVKVCSPQAQCMQARPRSSHNECKLAPNTTSGRPFSDWSRYCRRWSPTAAALLATGAATAAAATGAATAAHSKPCLFFSFTTHTIAAFTAAASEAYCNPLPYAIFNELPGPPRPVRHITWFLDRSTQKKGFTCFFLISGSEAGLAPLRFCAP